MKPLELARRYLEIVFDEGDVDALADIFAEDLIFRGPLFSFDSAEDYIQSLKDAPFVGANYQVLHTFSDARAACVLYQFTKPDVSVAMAQLFEVENHRICRITLVFDSAAL